jgi:hypothetical protein
MARGKIAQHLPFQKASLPAVKASSLCSKMFTVQIGRVKDESITQ